jgi:uncharacterized protein
MTLIDTLRAAQLQARKDKLTTETSLYTTLLGEALMIGKNNGNRPTTDTEVVAVVQKFLKNNQETVSILTKDGRDTAILLHEQRLLMAMLPKQLTSEELTLLAQSHTSLGLPGFMQFLKKNHAGQYDGKLAASVSKIVFGV